MRNPFYKWYNLAFLVAGFALMIPTSLIAQSKGIDTVRVYYLGGQSNMDGYGYNKDLPDSLSFISKDVWIFHGNPVGDDLPDGGLGIWAPLQPGHGTGFKSDGTSNTLSQRFGVELSMANRLQELYPGERIAEGLVRYKSKWFLYYGTADSYVGLAIEE
jgi:hypothetical protein